MVALAALRPGFSAAGGLPPSVASSAGRPVYPVAAASAPVAYRLQVSRGASVSGTGVTAFWSGRPAFGRRRRRPSHARLAVVSVSAGVAEGASNQEKKVNVLVLGGGGREHALCWALSRSARIGELVCAPGNAGIAAMPGVVCHPALRPESGTDVALFCRSRSIGLVVIGPEAPLVAGVSDALTAVGVRVFGPSAAAARLEGSKSFMKALCEKYRIPTAGFASFTDAASAKAYVRALGAPVVIKADGLAAGKGVVVAATVAEAVDAIEAMMVRKTFGAAGETVVVEEFLDGEEASFFALVDGTTALPLGTAQDHKAVGAGDTGPNTGGMGAYSPAAVVTPEIQEQVMRDIVRPAVAGMAADGCPFTGVLFAGLMIDRRTGVAKLLEFNVRFGDPECQALMLRLQSDALEVLLAAAEGRLAGMAPLVWSPESALVVILAATGYPGDYVKGTLIRGLDAAAAQPRARVFHSGTARDAAGGVVSAGGRVLGVCATGATVGEAQRAAYEAVDCVDWPGGFCRRDIGWKAVAREDPLV